MWFVNIRIELETYILRHSDLHLEDIRHITTDMNL